MRIVAKLILNFKSKDIFRKIILGQSICNGEKVQEIVEKNVQENITDFNIAY